MCKLVIDMNKLSFSPAGSVRFGGFPKHPLTMPSTDRDTLVALLHSTGGAVWQRKDNWETNADLSLWYGVDVDDKGRVVALDLEKNNLEGILLGPWP